MEILVTRAGSPVHARDGQSVAPDNADFGRMLCRREKSHAPDEEKVLDVLHTAWGHTGVRCRFRGRSSRLATQSWGHFPLRSRDELAACLGHMDQLVCARICSWQRSIRSCLLLAIEKKLADMKQPG